MKALLKSLLLLFIAIFLYLTLWVIWFFFEVWYSIYEWWMKWLSKYLYKIARSIDQTWNATAWILLSLLFININSEHFSLFWSEDETVSSVIGKNQEKMSLSLVWRAINAILHWLDPGHSIKAIERDEVY